MLDATQLPWLNAVLRGGAMREYPDVEHAPIFDGPPDNVALLGSAVAALVALLIACVVILERRVRAVDVVA